MPFPHLTADPNILGSNPIVAGTRISVALIMAWLGTGASVSRIAAKHPLLTEEKVLEARQETLTQLLARPLWERLTVLAQGGAT